jgi:hypothetical protein
MYKDRETFFTEIKINESRYLLDAWFSGTRLPFAFDSEDSLKMFFNEISKDWTSTERLAIGGTGAWRYSLNPKKEFREFSNYSDIDVINVSELHFIEIWNRIREYHRKWWYSIPSTEKERLRRNGQNVYSGFVSPKWIPDDSDDLKFKFLTSLERYSTDKIGYRNVNMLFFRNFTEVKDYYRRGIEIAKTKV